MNSPITSSGMQTQNAKISSSTSAVTGSSRIRSSPLRTSKRLRLPMLNTLRTRSPRFLTALRRRSLRSSRLSASASRRVE